MSYILPVYCMFIFIYVILVYVGKDYKQNEGIDLHWTSCFLKKSDHFKAVAKKVWRVCELDRIQYKRNLSNTHSRKSDPQTSEAQFSFCKKKIYNAKQKLNFIIYNENQRWKDKVFASELVVLVWEEHIWLTWTKLLQFCCLGMSLQSYCHSFTALYHTNMLVLKIAYAVFLLLKKHWVTSVE